MNSWWLVGIAKQPNPIARKRCLIHHGDEQHQKHHQREHDSSSQFTGGAVNLHAHARARLRFKRNTAPLLSRVKLPIASAARLAISIEGTTPRGRFTVDFKAHGSNHGARVSAVSTDESSRFRGTRAIGVVVHGHLAGSISRRWCGLWSRCRLWSRCGLWSRLWRRCRLWSRLWRWRRCRP